MGRETVRLGDGSKIVFHWSSFAALRAEGMELAVQEGEKLANKANNFPQPASTKKYQSYAGSFDTVIVAPVTPHAKNSNAKHNTLLKLLGGG